MVILPILGGFGAILALLAPPPKGQIGTNFFLYYWQYVYQCRKSVWRSNICSISNFYLSWLWCFLYIEIYLHIPFFDQKPFFLTPGGFDEFSWYLKNSFSGVLSIGRRCKKSPDYLRFVNLVFLMYFRPNPSLVLWQKSPFPSAKMGYFLIKS